MTSGLDLCGVAVLPGGGVDLKVAPGEIVVLLGPNGAGKTELLETVIGLRRPLAGTIRFDGRDLDGLSADRRARAGFGWCPQGRRVFPGLTVRENLDVACRAGRAGRARHFARVAALFPSLVPHWDLPAWRLSGGQQQMLAIGRALMTDPRLLLLDEPSQGLAPALVGDVMACLAQLAGEGIGILLAEQAAGAVRDVAGRMALLARGRIVADGTSATVLHDPAFSYVFLGR